MEKELLGAVADRYMGNGLERLAGVKLGLLDENTTLMTTLTYKLSFVGLYESPHCAGICVVMLEPADFNRAYGRMVQ